MVVDGLVAVGDFVLFAWQAFVWLFTQVATQRDVAAQLLPGGRAEPAGGRVDRDLHWDGAGRSESFSVPSDRVGNATRCGDQYVAGAGVGTGAGGDDAGRPRGQCDGGRAWDDARHGTDRCAREHGSQPDPLSGGAAFPGLHLPDSHADDHGRLHGSRGRILLQCVHPGIDRHFYLHNSQEFVGGFDLFVGVFKSLFFGAAIAMVSCYRGFHCTPGAEGVGRAATAAFVISFVLILVLDLFLGIVLDAIYYCNLARWSKAVLLNPLGVVD